MISTSIKSARLEKNLNELDVSSYLGISIDSYWDIENDDGEEFFDVISIAVAIKLCNLLNINISKLIFANDEDISENRFNIIFHQRRVELNYSFQFISDSIGYDLEFITLIENSQCKFIELNISKLFEIGELLNINKKLIISAAKKCVDES